MTTLTHTYPNGHTRTYTVTSALVGSEPGTAIITTTEDAAVVLSAADTPVLYAQLVASGLLA